MPGCERHFACQFTDCVEDFWIRRGSLTQCGYDVPTLHQTYLVECSGGFEVVKIIGQATLTAHCFCNVLKVLLV